MTKESKRTEGDIMCDGIYVWGDNHTMIADLPDDIDEDTYLFRMRGVGGGMSIEEQEANAKFMVKAWNNHERLVEALRELLKTSKTIKSIIGDEKDFRALQYAISGAEKALKEAESE